MPRDSDVGGGYGPSMGTGGGVNPGGGQNQSGYENKFPPGVKRNPANPGWEYYGQKRDGSYDGFIYSTLDGSRYRAAPPKEEKKAAPPAHLPAPSGGGGKAPPKKKEEPKVDKPKSVITPEERKIVSKPAAGLESTINQPEVYNPPKSPYDIPQGPILTAPGSASYLTKRKKATTNSYLTRSY